MLAVGGVLQPSRRLACCSASATSRGRRPERIRQAGVAVVPEGRRLLPELTVEDNLRVATLRAARARTPRPGIAYALELFPELEKRLDVPARSLSGGEQQMLVLAQALVSEPRFVLIDELSLGLAPVVVKRLIPTHPHGRRVRRRRAADRAVRARSRSALANRAYVMDGGRIRYPGTASELREKPELLQLGLPAARAGRRGAATGRRRSRLGREKRRLGRKGVPTRPSTPAGGLERSIGWV